MYKIIRFFSTDKPSRIIARGLTLKQAQEWCNDPETSSSTAITNRNKYPKAVKWFDGYESE